MTTIQPTAAARAAKNQKREAFKAAILAGAHITEAAKIAGVSLLQARLWRGEADFLEVMRYRVDK